MGEIDLADLVQHGVAVVVATRDAWMHPELGRAWGPALSADGDRLTVCVEAPPGSAMAQNLEFGAPVATTITRLASGATVTLRGRVVATPARGPGRLAAVAGHVEAFVAELAAVGVSASVARAMVGADLRCVTVELTEPITAAPEPVTQPAADRPRTTVTTPDRP